MSAAALAAVTALSIKANELRGKGHYARAAEKFAASAAAAQALGISDCLITASLQLEEASCLLGHSGTAGVPPADAAAAQQRAFRTLLPLAASTLDRRRAAGTLLVGACRPAEVAWDLEVKLGVASREGKPPAGFEHKLAALALYIGYDAYLTAGYTALYGLATDALPAELGEFAVSAVDLMKQPRGDSNMIISGEHLLLRVLGPSIQRGVLHGDAPWRGRLLKAWERLRCSGVLRERRLDDLDFADDLTRGADELAAKTKAKRVGEVLRACALEACAAREVHEAQFKKCAACQTVVYCCKQHQEQHWPAHKAACKAARKAAAQGGAGPISGA
jgi:hypothetical protein